MTKKLTNSIKSLSIVAFLYDLIALAFVWCFAFMLRFNFNIPASHIQDAITFFPLNAVIHGICFYYFGLYRGVWRFASLPDLKRIVRAVMLSALIVMSLSLIVRSFLIIPRAVLVLNPLLLILAMGGSRFAYRAWKERHMFNTMALKGKPVLVIGVEEVALNLIKELTQSEDWRVVAIIDPANKLVGRDILHTRVEGSLDELLALADKYNCQHCIVAMPSANHKMRTKIVDIARSVDQMEILTLPAMGDLMSGKITLSMLRKIDVEDLLGRDVVKLDTEGLHHLIKHRAVFVSGAGGSIGSELCSQVLMYEPSQLVCVDISEFALYQLEQALCGIEFAQKIEVIYVTANVKNVARIKTLLQAYKPSVVFHAAAYKHVPMMENINVAEALSNNVLGTFSIANACKEVGIEKFVLISTDKAVNPTNVMGASKRLSEMVCQGLQDTAGTKFVIVRFGNVLGSSGSVIPKFREQIAAGGPITVTHPEITRYFMSIPEAAQLVMQAGLMGQGGEIFVLNMGEPVKIVDLAKDMIRLSGFQQDEIKITYTGLRPGEKLYEELLADDEHTLPTPHHKLRIAGARSADMLWVKNLIKWIDEIQHADEALIKEQLKNWVEEYTVDTNFKQSNTFVSTITTIH